MKYALLVLTAGIGLTTFTAPVRAQDCSQFQYQEEAQQLLNRSRQRFADGNGRACEKLPSIATVTDEDPWALSEPLLLGDLAPELAGYYEGVILAGDSLKTQAFLEYHNLTVQFVPTYSSIYPIWAACQEIRGPGSDRGAQTVCVAVDGRKRPLDDRIFDQDYSNDVALEIFDWF